MEAKMKALLKEEEEENERRQPDEIEKEFM